MSTTFIGKISIRTSARALPSSTNFYPENCLRHFAKIAKFLSGQTYGISKNFANFYPVLDTAFEGIFQGPLFPDVEVTAPRVDQTLRVTPNVSYLKLSGVRNVGDLL